MEQAAAWPSPAKPVAQVRLTLDEKFPDGERPPVHDISAAARAGDTLFLGADECANIEILTRSGDRFADHRRICLSSLFDLPGGDDELDIEGLAVDGDWLWVVGSHSLTRRKPKKRKPLDAAAIQRLAELKDNANRMFLGRLPLREVSADHWDICLDGAGGRRPQMLRIGKRGSHLQQRLKKDRLIAPFCALPAKENGLDVEGVVVDGHRVGLGLRGPVVNGWAMVIEAQVRTDRGAALKLDGPIQKHFLDLGGLGVRDLKRRNGDVLILAGPTMKLDGPSQIFRWSGWRNPPTDGDLLHRPERLLDLPYGLGCDHPEALAPIRHHGADALLVVCDTPGPHRLSADGVLADVFVLPA
jgi:hypothetical protein